MVQLWITPTARNHIRKVINDTRNKWGTEQAAKYHRELEEGLQHIADNYHNFNSPHRDEMVKGTAFSIRLVEHHYVAFQEDGKGGVIIAGVFHKSMDIPTRLKDLQSMVRQEIDALRREIAHTQNKKS